MKSFTSKDGLNICFRDEGQPDGRRVILQHGFMSDGERNWITTGIVSRLSDAGCRIILPDARGHGKSDHPHEEAFYGESRMAADIMGIADMLGFENYAIGGYSMGAVVALLTAIEDSRVTRMAIGGVGEGVVVLGGTDGRIASREDIAAALLAKSVEDTAPPASGFRMAADMAGGDRKAYAAQAMQLHRGQLPLGDIKMPSYLFAGDNDPFAISPEALSEAIPGCELALFKGGHGDVFTDPALAVGVANFLSK